MATKALIRELKELITNNDLAGLQQYYRDMQQYEDPMPWDVIFKDVYIHACLKKRHNIIAWLQTVYDGMDDIMKIALRQVFPYGRYLLAH